MPRHLSRGQALRQELIKEWHKSGHNLETLTQKLNTDIATTGILLDNALRGLVPITGKANQAWLHETIQNRDDFGRGNKGTMEEISKHVGKDFTLRWYKGEVGKTLPSGAENLRVKIIGHKAGAGRNKGDFVSTSWMSDMAGAIGSFGRVVMDYEDDEIDDIDIETFEYNGEE